MHNRYVLYPSQQPNKLCYKAIIATIYQFTNISQQPDCYKPMVNLFVTNLYIILFKKCFQNSLKIYNYACFYLFCFISSFGTSALDCSPLEGVEDKQQEVDEVYWEAH